MTSMNHKEPFYISLWSLFALTFVMLGLFLTYSAKVQAFSPCDGQAAEVRGASLSPVLPASGAWVRIRPLSCLGRSVRAGDMVVFTTGGHNAPVIKIVHGVEGDRFDLVRADRGTILRINGRVLKNSEGALYTIDDGKARLLALYAGTLPQGSLLVLGNAVAGTLDSTRFGLVNLVDVIGVAERVSPEVAAILPQLP